MKRIWFKILIDISRVMITRYPKLTDTFILQSQFHDSCEMAGGQVDCSFIGLSLLQALRQIYVIFKLHKDICLWVFPPSFPNKGRLKSPADSY